MSTASPANPDLDFWEFVNCARCRLPFVTDTGTPSVPFWLTECGHVICNNHLNADQSCAQCGDQGIQLMPLQREMEPPMSDWFRSVPLAFDAVAYAARFQMETLASLVRHYKDKYTHQRTLLDRVKNEYKNLKNRGVALRERSATTVRSLRGGGPSDLTNINGKRRMLDSHRHLNGSRTNSSPRSIATPIGPNRLTLPPDHQQPNFASHHASRSGDTPRPQSFQDNGNTYAQQKDRPGSSRFMQQYAYMPEAPQTQTVPVSTLSHAQAAPMRQAVTHQTQGNGTPSRRAHTTMMPPPQPVSRDLRSQFQGVNTGVPSANAQDSLQFRGGRQMPPPPTPQLRRNTLQQRSSFRPPATPQMQAAVSDSSHPGRFVPSTPTRTAASTMSNRFMLQQQGSQLFSNSGSASTNQMSGSSSRAPSRAASMAMPGGQRMPFIPNS